MESPPNGCEVNFTKQMTEGRKFRWKNEKDTLSKEKKVKCWGWESLIWLKASLACLENEN